MGLLVYDWKNNNIRISRNCASLELQQQDNYTLLNYQTFIVYNHYYC